MLGKAILEVGPNAFQNEKPEKAAEAFKCVSDLFNKCSSCCKFSMNEPRSDLILLLVKMMNFGNNLVSRMLWTRC